MNSNLSYTLLLAVVILLLILELSGSKRFLKLWFSPSRKSKEPKPQVMKPRSEKDCPHCQQTLTSEKTRVVLPTPWYQRKGKGGPKKTVPTRHQFCSNPNCDYYLITDENVHALVGYGSHGKYEHIQDLFCQACKKKFTIRRRTILYRLKTHSKTVRLSLALLALGMNISSLEEAIEIRECTLRVWLTRSGDQGRKLHERFFTMLDMAHVQLDELWANGCSHNRQWITPQKRWDRVG